MDEGAFKASNPGKDTGARVPLIRVPLIARSWDPGLEEVETQGGT